MTIQEEIELNQEEAKILDKKLKRLGKKNKKWVDKAFHTAHDEVFEEIDCLDCGNCCKTTSPIFRDVDIKKMSKKMRIKEIDFITQYLYLDNEHHYVLKTAPCPFLDLTDNKCTQYDVRPQACREYPHTNRKSMVQIIGLTYENTQICPAAARIVRRITL